MRHFGPVQKILIARSVLHLPACLASDQADMIGAAPGLQTGNAGQRHRLRMDGGKLRAIAQGAVIKFIAAVGLGPVGPGITVRPATGDRVPRWRLKLSAARSR